MVAEIDNTIKFVNAAITRGAPDIFTSVKIKAITASDVKKTYTQ